VGPGSSWRPGPRRRPSCRSGTRPPRAWSPGRNAAARRPPPPAAWRAPRLAPNAAPGRWPTPGERRGGCGAGAGGAAGRPAHPAAAVGPACRLLAACRHRRARRAHARTLPGGGAGLQAGCLAGPMRRPWCGAGPVDKDRGQVAVCEATVDRRVPQRPAHLGRAVQLGQRHRLAILARTRLLPATPASASHTAAPSPIARNCASAALWPVGCGQAAPLAGAGSGRGQRAGCPGWCGRGGRPGPGRWARGGPRPPAGRARGPTPPGRAAGAAPSTARRRTPPSGWSARPCGSGRTPACTAGWAAAAAGCAP
jgi:hypothetical protein